MIHFHREHTSDRVLRLAILTMLVAGCPEDKPEAAKRIATPPTTQAPAVHAPAAPDTPQPAPPEPSGATMNIAQITKEDCEAIRAALVQRIESSNSIAAEERAIWLNTIRSTAVTKDVEGTWTIGDWFLVPDDAGLMLSRNSGRTREESVGHVTALSKQNGTWVVGEIRPKFVHPRR